MPEHEDVWPETTRQLAALYQITAAIEHFDKGDLECAITLASAAEGVLPDANDGALFQTLRNDPEARNLDLNFVQNWLKHGKFKGQELESLRIDGFLAAISVWRAITKFVAVYRKETPEMAKFMSWSWKEAFGHPPMRRKRRQVKLTLVR